MKGKEGEYVSESHKKSVPAQRAVSWRAGCSRCGYSTGGRREGAGLHAPQHDGGEDQPEPIPGEEACPPRVLRRRFRRDVNEEPLGQEGRLPEVPGSRCPDSRNQRQRLLFAEDVC